MATAKKSHAAADTVETWTNVNPESLKQGYEKFAKGFSKLADFNRESMEAWMASAGAIAKGVEKAASENSAFAKASYEDTLAAFKAATASKSVQEAMSIQTDYLRSVFEKNLGQFNKLAEQWVATTKEAAEPLNVRYGEFVDMVQSYRP